MTTNLAHKLIAAHLAEGKMIPGEEIALHIDQTLTQDATGTLVMLELEALHLDRARTQLSVQYVDHNLLQQDNLNAEDHVFLQSACERFGLWFSRPGNGVSHPLHQERFGKPGKTLLGSDSHTCAAGAIGMLAIGAGGLDVALAIAGEPLRLVMPRVMGVRLTGKLPDWVSAKDLILEMLRRHTVKGGVGRVIEYYGPGVETLSAMDRHVIANMGAELGATASVFPSDHRVREFLALQRREEDYHEWRADAGATYDDHDEIDLSKLEPMIAMPSSPDNVVTVREVAGQPIYQAYIGSSANPGYRDFAIAARIVAGHQVHPRVSLDINPSSRPVLESLARDLHLNSLLHAGARLHQAGCNGCIGMGQAPVPGHLSLRTVPRNFPGRSGTHNDQVCLCSPETAAASAIRGEITDPRALSLHDPQIAEPEPSHPIVNEHLFFPPLSEHDAEHRELVKGPNIISLPDFDPFPDALNIPILLKVGDNISTDEIMPAGARVLPYRSNIPKISEFVFNAIDSAYPARAVKLRLSGGHVLLGGENYGQGSSREHAALAPRYLGLRIVLAKSFARIHGQNLVNWGVLPLLLAPEDYDHLQPNDSLTFKDLRARITEGTTVPFLHHRHTINARLQLSPRQRNILLAGSLINFTRKNTALSVHAHA